MSYAIRSDYRARDKFVPLNHTRVTVEFQNSVYRYAAELRTREALTTVLDVGCGGGYKTRKYFGNDALGLEVPPNIEWLQKTYPDGHWQLSDFSSPLEPFDLIVCADVIEHLEDPDALMLFLRDTGFKHLVLSTPERETLLSTGRAVLLGPPRNKCHMREWSFSEFAAYVSQWFNIAAHILCDVNDETQLIHAVGNR